MAPKSATKTRLDASDSHLSELMAPDDPVARLVIAQSGHILYATKAFEQLSETHDYPIKAAQAFAFEDQAFEEGDVLPEIEAGTHPIRINGQDKMLNFRFDWLDLPERGRYLIGSAITGEEHDHPFSPEEIEHVEHAILERLEDPQEEPENDLATMRKALEKREKQLSRAESIGRMGHWEWNINQGTMEWSEQIYNIFGLESGQFTPSFDALLNMIHKEDSGRVMQGFQRAMIEKNNYDMEFRLTRPDGEIRAVFCEGRCAEDTDGEVTALYGIMQDMTERMLYEQNLKAAKEEAERAYAAKTQFLANMSHELRTPLNAIIGFSEMMQNELLGPLGNDKYVEYIGNIRQSGAHLLDIISDILDMSKIEAGKYDLDLQEINIAKTLATVMQMMEARAGEAAVALALAKDIREDLKIVADRRAFLQVMLNLLSNAVKFTPEGGSINIECYERENYLAIKVRDTGIGIPANKLQTITHPFEQVSSHYTRDHEGAGLGLAITKELIELHGGVLFLESKVDEGTTVTVRLPYEPDL